MGVKMTGEQYKRFVDDKELWNNGDYYWDDTVFKVNGEELEDFAEDDIKDTDKVEICYGSIYSNKAEHHAVICAATTLARKFMAKETNIEAIVSIPKTVFDMFKAELPKHFPLVKLKGL